ncbi:MAG: HAMP domain-containing protein [Gammaproteobacteria bacterium]
MRRRSQLATRLGLIFGIAFLTCLSAYAFLQREISHIQDTLEHAVTGGYDMLGSAQELENLITESAASLRRLRNAPERHAQYARDHDARTFARELEAYGRNAASSEAQGLAAQAATLHGDYLLAVDALLAALAADAIPLAGLEEQVGEFALRADELIRDAGADIATEHELRTAALDIERRLHDYVGAPDAVHAASLEIALRTLEHRLVLAATQSGLHPQAPFITTLREQLRALRHTAREALERQRDVDAALGVVYARRDQLRALIHDRLASAARGQVERAEQAVGQRIAEARTRVTLLLSAMILLCAGAAWAVVRNFLRPVSQLVVALRSAGRGDLAQRVNLRAKNELGEIGAAFNDMAARLERATVSRAYLDQILTALPGGVIVLDGSLAILKVNPGGCALFGGCAAELVGENFARLLADGDGRVWTPVPGETEERRIVCGRPRALQVLVSTTALGGGAPDGAAYVCHVTDITRRKEAEEALARSRDELRAAYVALQRVQEDERSRLAREVHDEFGAILTVMGNTVFALDDLTADEAEKTRVLLDRLHELVERASAATDRIVDGLHPPILDHFGLSAALEWYVDDFKARSGLACSLKLGAVPELSPEQSLALFRVLQEGLTNVTRHAAARHVQVALEADDDAVTLSVADDGRGFAEGTVGGEPRHGLRGLAERMANLGGDFTAEGRREQGGARLVARLPLTSRAAGERTALYAIEGGRAGLGA